MSWSPFLVALTVFSFVAPLPQDPRQWGDGLLAAFHEVGQTQADLSTGLVSPDATLVVWQDDSGKDPDLAIQHFSSNGRAVAGDNGRRWDRPGIQTNPLLADTAVVFRESQDGENWQVLLGHITPKDFVLTPISDARGGKSELSLQTSADVSVATWIQETGDVREIVAAITEHGITSTIRVAASNNLTGMNALIHNDLVFWVWTDWRNVSPAVYGQCFDRTTHTFFWPDNGLWLSPDHGWAWNANLCASEPGYTAITYEEWDGSASALYFQIVDVMMNRRFSPTIQVSGTPEDVHAHAATRFNDHTFVVWASTAKQGETLTSATIDFNGHDAQDRWQFPTSDRIRDLQTLATETAAWAVWETFANRVLAQRFTVANQSVWPVPGVDMTSRDGLHTRPTALAHADNSLVVAWEWRENETPQILVQKLR